MTIATEPPIEFVDRAFAEAEAKRAIELLQQADGIKVEACFALQAVANQIGPASNVGLHGVSWAQAGPSRWRYNLSANCRDGLYRTSTGAPDTLEEAKQPEWLEKVSQVLEKMITQNGGLLPRARPAGTGEALISAVEASPEGIAWLAQRSHHTGRQKLLAMVAVADRYGRDGIYPPASITAHVSFITRDDRNELIRDFPESAAAAGKAMALKRDIPMVPHRQVKSAQVRRLAVMSGVTQREARLLLYAVMDGRSKLKLVRAINEAIKMVEGMSEPHHSEQQAA